MVIELVLWSGVKILNVKVDVHGVIVHVRTEGKVIMLECFFKVQ